MAKPAWMTIGGRMLDLLYPPRCELCAEPLTGTRSLCESCEGKLPGLDGPHCKLCGEPFDGNLARPIRCPHCADLRFAFEFARPAMRRDPQLLGMIHRLKYGRYLHLAESLGRLAQRAFDDPRLASARAEGWPLIPVPLHRWRLAHRHFNQAHELARVLARLSGLPLLPALKRIRATGTQTHLKRHERMANLKGAFAITRDGQRWIEHAPAAAILIDDVLTTGSTVDACAKCLRAAGFQRVMVVTLMRG